MMWIVEMRRDDKWIDGVGECLPGCVEAEGEEEARGSEEEGSRFEWTVCGVRT